MNILALNSLWAVSILVEDPAEFCLELERHDKRVQFLLAMGELAGNSELASIIELPLFAQLGLIR